MKKVAVAVATAIILSGCSTMRSYKSEQKPVIENLAGARVDEALAKLEESAPKEKDLLYYLEKGELLRLKRSFADSLAAWTQADSMIAQWEAEEKVNMRKAGESVGSVILNDKIRNYDGEDYEKVLLSTRQALNYLANNKTEDAMVEIKKTWEREAFIKELHSKETQQAEDKAKKEGYTTKSEDLKGYPVATLNSPDVMSLKNGYQSAFSQYLSGFLSEATGDIGNAAAGYREAIELQPSLTSIKQHLAGLDSRINSSKSPDSGKKKLSKTSKKSKTPEVVEEPLPANESDVLVVVENGLAPNKNGITIPIPIPKAGIVPISFPVLETDPLSTVKATGLVLPNGQSVKLETITNVELMAKRSLKDNLPGIMVRAAIRAAIKGGMQAAAYSQNAYAGLAVNLVNVATEQADERLWKSLPQEITIARVHLPEGTNQLKLQTNDGERVVNATVSGKYSVIPIRVVGKASFVLQK